MASTTCFVCSRCEHPICSREDIIITSVANGTTENAFMYDLEDMLNLETSVPCYSGDEVDEVSVAVSEKILAAPFPPAARLLALEAVVESQRFQQQQDVRGIGGSSPRGEREADSVADASLPGSVTENPPGGVRSEGENNPLRAEQNSSNSGTYRSAIQSLARFRRVKESRLDLVCVKEDVLTGGLACCTKDRGADIPPRSHSPSSATETATVEDVGVTTSVSRSSGEDSGGVSSSMRHVQTILEAAQRPPLRTRWSTHPGNFDVEEAFIHVRRRTKTARCPWFEAYDCHVRLECPDCHLGLGYLFTKKETHVEEEVVSGASGVPAYDAESEGENVEGAHEPHQKRERREDNVRCDEDNQPDGQQQQQRDAGGAEQFPATFVGLELKKIRQREWGLRDFQKRYQQAKNLKTFRELFPEAEELESLYGRLTALRTQSELYNNLLRKHKEQNDVQSALLQSQKERINTYEEKLGTMQQIIEAQRTQLEMQGRQIKHQEELVRNQKSQVVTQRHQIYVEQLLLSEQSRTIVTQREQLSLIQAHLRAQLIKERLEQRCGQLTTLLSQTEEERQGQRPAVALTNESLHHSTPRATNLPPRHLIGITGYDPRDDGSTHLEEDSEHRESVVQSRHASRSNALPPLHASSVGTEEEGRSDAQSGAHEWVVKKPLTTVVGGRRESRLSSSSNGKDAKISERTAAIMLRIAEERELRSTHAGSLRSTNVNNNINNGATSTSTSSSTATTTTTTTTTSSSSSPAAPRTATITGNNSMDTARAEDGTQAIAPCSCVAEEEVRERRRKAAHMVSRSLEEENKELRRRISVLELELKQRNADCATFRDEALQVVQLKKKIESQSEVIVALRSELEYARASHASAVEALEEKKKSRDREHQECMQRVVMRLSADDSAPKITALPKVNTAVGGVLQTSSGPQVVCKSSDISSIGFTRVERPVDFLGGMQSLSLQQDPHSCRVSPEVSDGEKRGFPGFSTSTPKATEHMKNIRGADDDDDDDELRRRFEALRGR